MELRVLKYFQEVAKEQNITKAAENLHITQPTLSRQLKSLEEELGQQLFVRSSHNIQLTNEGKLLSKRTADILNMVDKTTNEFKAMHNFTGGYVDLGCAESIAKTAKNLLKEYPNIQLNMYSGNATSVCDQLDKGLLDFAVIVQDLDISKYNSINIPFHDRWGLIMRKDSPFVSKKSIHLDDLYDIPLLVSRQRGYNKMAHWLNQNESRLNIVATFDLIYNAAILVKENVGYALGFDNLVNTSLESVLCFRPIEPEIQANMYLIWKKNQILSKSATLFLEQLQSQMK